MNLTRLFLAAVVLLVGVPIVWGMLIEIVRRASPLTALVVMIVIVTAILLYGYVLLDRASATWRKARTPSDGREREVYRPDPGER
jgi:hypothetical protein